LNAAQPTIPTSSNAVASAEQGVRLALIREVPEGCNDGKQLVSEQGTANRRAAVS